MTKVAHLSATSANYSLNLQFMEKLFPFKSLFLEIKLRRISYGIRNNSEFNRKCQIQCSHSRSNLLLTNLTLSWSNLTSIVIKRASFVLKQPFLTQTQKLHLVVFKHYQSNLFDQKLALQWSNSIRFALIYWIQPNSRLLNLAFKNRKIKILMNSSKLIGNCILVRADF